MNAKRVLQFLVVIIFFTVLARVFIVLNHQFEAVGNSVVSRFGLPGLFGGVFLMDFVLQPLPPDLLVYSYVFAGSPVLKATLIAGCASVMGGLASYGMGYLLEEGGVDKYLGRKNYDKAHKLFVKHGVVAIVVAALTPVPFNVACWSAGIFGMPFRSFFISTVLARMPRFYIVAYVALLTR
jgi:membrane protein YqaA with SNARE-associated domain